MSATDERNADFRIVLCEACGSEGSIYRRAMVYEPGCGHAHSGEEYVGPCEYCDGTGEAVIEVEPIECDDLEAMGPPS